MDPQQQQNDQDGGGGGCRGGGGGGSSSSYLCRQSSTRWTPTTEQIRILKDLYYNNGVRSPSAEQIQRISARLRQYGKIEGKNVFYWFQNHKARERQKQKRNSLGLSHCPRSNQAAAITTTTTTITLDTKGGVEVREGDSPYKRKCRSWVLESLQLEQGREEKEEVDETLELFPLHPEGR